MAKPSVLVIYNLPLLPEGHPDYDQEFTVKLIVDAVKVTLSEAGHEVSELGVGNDPSQLWSELRKRRPGVVFNLYEGTLYNPETESYVAGLLEWSGIPFTGSPSAATSLARAKHTAKHVLKGAGLPTADFFVVQSPPVPPCRLDFPVIVKPALQDGSVGMTHQSVCVNPIELDQRVRYLLTTYGPPVIVEQYIDGREFNVGLVDLVDLRAFLVSEVDLVRDQPGHWPIVTYTAKWEPLPLEKDWAPTYPADLAGETLRAMESLAWQAFQLMGCRDYARVDFRMNPAGKLFVLEVNPNPEVSESAGFSDYQDANRFSYAEFVVRLVEQAHRRAGAPRPSFAPAPRTAPIRPKKKPTRDDTRKR